jgi:hypothetical protein
MADTTTRQRHQLLRDGDTEQEPAVIFDHEGSCIVCRQPARAGYLTRPFTYRCIHHMALNDAEREMINRLVDEPR